MNEGVSLTQNTNLENAKVDGAHKVDLTFSDLMGESIDFSLPEKTDLRKLRSVDQIKISEAKTQLDILNLKNEYDKDLAKRTITRMVLEEMQNQEKFEDIAKNSIKYLPEKISDKPVDKTWARKFFDKSKVITDEEVQDYWSKILAGEITTPGTYSIKTLNILEEMDKEDIKLFSRIASISYQGIIFYYDANFFNKKLDIVFSDLSHLSYLGLINFSAATVFYIDFKLEEAVIIEFKNKIFRFKPNVEGEFPINSLFLTKSGIELLRIINYDDSEEYFTYFEQKLKKQFPKIEFY